MIFDLSELPCHICSSKGTAERVDEFLPDWEERLRIDSISYATDKGGFGCAQSHIMSMEKAGAGPYIILEDDAGFTEWYDPIIEVPDDADCVYLGIVNAGARLKRIKKQRVGEKVWKVENMIFTHALLMVSDKWIEECQKAAQYVRNHYRQDNLLDNLYGTMQGFYNVYAISPPPFYQNSWRKGQTYITF